MTVAEADARIADLEARLAEIPSTREHREARLRLHGELTDAVEARRAAAVAEQRPSITLGLG